MRWFSRLTATVSGLLVGMLLTEILFAARDRFSFPHLNLYLPDEALGVRLIPSSRERISFGGNPVSTVHVNGLGYRGSEWSSPPPQGEILVVGDSQVFGLGVEDHETHPARLAAHTGRPVLNGGVPTYGPREYLAAAEEILSTRDGIDTLVVVFNFSNDLFEIDRPNRERHAVWDGWAVRIETAPEETLWFPGRDLLYRKSHAFFALRKLIYSRERGTAHLPSEGSLLDVVVAASERSTELHEELEEGITSARERSAERYKQEVAALAGEADLLRVFGYLSFDNLEDAAAVNAYVGNKHPGDIVGVSYGESARPVEVTAELLARGAAVRRELRDRLRLWAEEHPGEPISAQIWELLRAKGSLDPEIAGEAIPDLPLLGSPLDAALDEAKRLAERHGVDLLAVALPLDVQVSESQWAKYDLPPRDMSDTRVLLEDLGMSCAKRQIRFLDATDPLRELGDAAFLRGDLHLSPAGQDRLAKAVAETLARPPSPPPPLPGLPEGRARIPSEVEWAASRESLVRGSGRNRCSTRQIREWLRLDCEASPSAAMVGVDVTTPVVPSPSYGAVSAPLEIFGRRDPAHALLYVPLLEGREVSVRYRWEDHTERLIVTWAEGKARASFVESDPSLDPGAPLPETARDSTYYGLGPVSCAETYAGDEARFPLCASGERTHMPACPSGSVNAGSAGHCFALCSEALPCSAGVCTPWMGSAVCL